MNCFKCGTKNAIALFSSVLCVNKKCQHFDEAYAIEKGINPFPGSRETYERVQDIYRLRALPEGPTGIGGGSTDLQGITGPEFIADPSKEQLHLFHKVDPPKTKKYFFMPNPKQQVPKSVASFDNKFLYGDGTWRSWEGTWDIPLNYNHHNFQDPWQTTFSTGNYTGTTVSSTDTNYIYISSTI